MSLFTKLLRRTDEPTEVAREDLCPHTAIAPRWADPGDMGKIGRASQFVCDGCMQTFTPDEYQVLRQTEAERLKKSFT
jgi:hypothetical protein